MQSKILGDLRRMESSVLELLLKEYSPEPIILYNKISTQAEHKSPAKVE